MEASTVSQEPVVEETVVTSTENSTENINTTDNVTEEQTTSAETPKPMEKKLPSFTNKEGVRMIKLGRASAGHETAFLLTGDMMVLGWKSKAMSLKFGYVHFINICNTDNQLNIYIFFF